MLNVNAIFRGNPIVIVMVSGGNRCVAQGRVSGRWSHSLCYGRTEGVKLFLFVMREMNDGGLC